MPQSLTWTCKALNSPVLTFLHVTSSPCISMYNFPLALKHLFPTIKQKPLRTVLCFLYYIYCYSTLPSICSSISLQNHQYVSRKKSLLLICFLHPSSFSRNKSYFARKKVIYRYYERFGRAHDDDEELLTNPNILQLK